MLERAIEVAEKLIEALNVTPDAALKVGMQIAEQEKWEAENTDRDTAEPQECPIESLPIYTGDKNVV